VVQLSYLEDEYFSVLVSLLLEALSQNPGDLISDVLLLVSCRFRDNVAACCDFQSECFQCLCSLSQNETTDSPESCAHSFSEL